MHVTGGSGRRVEQITNELRDGYHIEGLEEVRVIRDRQTSKSDTTFSEFMDVLTVCRNIPTARLSPIPRPQFFARFC